MTNLGSVALGHGRSKRALPAALLRTTTTNDQFSSQPWLYIPLIFPSMAGNSSYPSEREALIHEICVALRKLVALSREDDRLPNTPITINHELISLELVENQLLSMLSYIKDRRSRLVASAFGLAAKGTIHTLPSEILIDISFFATAFNEKGWRQYASDPLPWGPLNLSHVCRKWQSLVQGASALWTQVVCREDLRPLVRLHLKRAKTLPVNLICVDGLDPVNSIQEGVYMPRFSKVRSLSWHIKTQLSHPMLFRLVLKLDALIPRHLHVSLKMPLESSRPWLENQWSWCGSLEFIHVAGW